LIVTETLKPSAGHLTLGDFSRTRETDSFSSIGLWSIPTVLPMAHDGSDKAFASSARLYAVVPETSNSRFSEVLSSASQDDEANGALPLPVKERKILFFGEHSLGCGAWYSLLLIHRWADERVIVYIVLRILNGSEQSLKQYLPRLQIKLDVWAISEAERKGSGGSKGEGSEPERDLVFSNTLEDVDDPLIVLNAEDEEDVKGEPVVLAIWQTEATLNRPRARFQSPALTFTASASLATSKLASETSTEDEYLAGFTPAPANLFESLKYLPALRNDPPYLPVSRLDRVLPDAPIEGGLIKIRHAPTRPIPVIQAVTARIRYSRLDAPSHRAAIIASLDFEVTRFMDLSVDLEAASVELSRGSTEALMPQQLPISCRPRDVMTFMYRLHPAHHFDTPSLPSTTTFSTVNGSAADVISISTLASISVSDACRAQISMVWTTQIDLSAPLNPNFGPPGQSLQRAKRPQSLPVGPAGSTTATVSSAGTPRTSVLWGSGITISFSGPTTPVEVGRTFVWKILVVNLGPKTAKLAIIPLPQIQRPYMPSQHLGTRHAPQISSSSSHHAGKYHTDRGSRSDIASAICDENIVYALQHQNPQNSGTELLSLTPELRIGPLAPGTCHEAEIRMLAFKQGPLRVEAVRIVDLVREIEEGATATDVMTDIRNLPDVVAVWARRKEGDDENSAIKHARDGSDGPESPP
jgi:hypothetical protein